MNAIQGSAQAAGSQQSPSSPEQPGGGIPYGSYGGSAGGSYGAAGYGGTGGYGGNGGGGWPGGNWNGGGNYPGGPTPPSRGRRIRRGLAIGTAGVALAAAAAVGWYDAVQPSGSSADKATTSANTNLTTAQISSKVDPGLVDVVSTLGYQKATAEGTGMVLTSTGEILTNNHVIDGATSIKVIDIGNGKTYTASVVGYNASKDIAVLQLQNASGLSTVSLGNSSSVTVGSKVTALGNAGGKEGTPSVATGTVTALSQSITASDEGSGNSEQLTGLIQSNAPIQAGDSGGPLVNSAGQVIGMDTAASSSSESPNAQADTPGSGNGWSGFGDGSGSTGSGSTGSGSTGSGSTAATQAFSIPINEAVTMAKQIVAGDASSTVHIGTTGFLGIEVSSADSSSSTGGFGENGGFGGSSSGTGTTTSGATVEGTLSGSPAATAGLAAGDVITSVAGQSVTSSAQISSILSSGHPGDKVTVIWTDTEGQSHTASIALASGPAA
jgi:S1-C subfamily serine protease